MCDSPPNQQDDKAGSLLSVVPDHVFSSKRSPNNQVSFNPPTSPTQQNDILNEDSLSGDIELDACDGSDLCISSNLETDKSQLKNMKYT